jgi:4-alpha-glucanotransferase
MSAISPQLQQLCQIHGVNTGYRDMNGLAREASEETLLAVLQSMGAVVHNSGDISAAHRLKHLQDWQSICPPVIVIWEGSSPVVNLHLPSYLLGASLPVSFFLESGELREFLWKVEPSAIIEQKNVEGSVYLVARFKLSQYLPLGYHKLKVELPGQDFESLIISAPMQAYTPLYTKTKKWGVFLPLYALHSSKSWGAGDYTDLRELMQWTSESGGEVVGTLPLLACFFDNRFGPGPYLPASKVFWNEFYLDISGIPEFGINPEAQQLFNSNDFQSELAGLRKSSNVLYDTELKLKRQILEKVSLQFWAEKPSRFDDFEIFLANHPSVMEYAHFRAAGEAYGLDWRNWPQRLPELNVDENSRNYHAYVQWLTTQQIRALNLQSGKAKTLLYMDLPIGVHPSSYDIWKEPESFVTGIDCGAPPDPVFTNGQNWGFPPLHPENIRRSGYQYFIQSLRHQLKSCGMLRLDHMMGFHRLFWIPQGMPNTGGTYVNYLAEEFYAILTLESARHKSIIIGEDLGLVPPEVRPMMEKHSIHRMFVGQFELISDNKLGIIPPNTVATLNTHDMFPFAAFWEEADISQRQKIKLIDDATAKAELDQRRETKRALISILQYKGLENDFDLDTAATLLAILRLLAESPAETVLINLEDLWLEQKPQNIPGTVRPQNWRHKAKYSFEQFTKLPVVVQLLKEIDNNRKGDGPKH